MAQLKDTKVTGNLNVTGKIYFGESETNLQNALKQDGYGNDIPDTYATRSMVRAITTPYVNYTSDIFDIDFSDGNSEKNYPCLFDENTENIPSIFFSGARYVIYHNDADIQITLIGVTVDNIPQIAIASYNGAEWSEWHSPVLQTI